MPRDATKIALRNRREAKSETQLVNANIKNKVANVYSERAAKAHAKKKAARAAANKQALKDRTSKQRDR